MRKIGFLVLSIIILVMNSASLGAGASAHRAGKCLSNDDLETVYRVEFVNLSIVCINATFGIHEMRIDNDRYTADDIRVNYSALEKNISKEIDRLFTNFLNTSFPQAELKEQVPVLVNESSLIDTDPHPCEPAVEFTKNATFDLNISGRYEKFDVEVAEGFLLAGGKLKFSLAKAEGNYTTTWLLPDWMNFSRAEFFIGKIKNKNCYSWDSSELPFDGFLSSDQAPVYKENKTLALITIDIYKIDIFKLTCLVDLNFSALLYWVECPEGFERHLPKNVTLDYINADLIRLFLAKNIIERTDLDNFTEETSQRLEENLSSAVGENVTLVAQINNESLEGYNVTNMSGERPIEILGNTSFEYKLSLERKNVTKGREKFAMVFELFTMPLNFTLNAIKGWNTTYKFILPPDIKLSKVSDSLQRASRGTQNNRDYFELWLRDNETDEVMLTLSLTSLIISFALPFIVIGALVGVVGIIIKIISWREEKFVRKLL